MEQRRSQEDNEGPLSDGRRQSEAHDGVVPSLGELFEERPRLARLIDAGLPSARYVRQETCAVDYRQAAVEARGQEFSGVLSITVMASSTSEFFFPTIPSLSAMASRGMRL